MNFYESMDIDDNYGRKYGEKTKFSGSFEDSPTKFIILQEKKRSLKDRQVEIRDFWSS